MTSLHIPHLVVKAGAHSPRYYWQPSIVLRKAGWKQRRLSDNEGLAIAEARQLNEAIAATKVSTPAEIRKTGTVSAGIAAYKRHTDYLELAASTRRVYDQSLDILKARFGRQLARSLAPKAFQDLYDEMRAKTPARANSVLGMARILFEHWRRQGMVSVNPVSKPKMKGLPPSGVIWPIGMSRLFYEEAERMGWHGIGVAVDLNEWLGQRESDVLSWTRGIYKKGELDFIQSKTTVRVILPLMLVPARAQMLAKEIARQDAARGNIAVLDPDALPLIADENGNAYTAALFRRHFSLVRAAVAVQHPEAAKLKFMHLRHTAVTRLAESTCELPLIAAVTGHNVKSVERIIERYLVRTREMARMAFGKRMEKEHAS